MPIKKIKATARKRRPAKPASNSANAKAASAAPKAKAPGIIATITELMQKPKGATLDEMVAALTKRFPERDAKGMGNTVRVQTSRQGAKRDDEGRYRVRS